LILPNEGIMGDFDTVFRKRLKRFAARQMPPANGRSKLLLSVSRSSAGIRSITLPERHPFMWKRTYETHKNSDWALFSIDWGTLYSLGALSMRNVL